jgi:hypothetical protein
LRWTAISAARLPTPRTRCSKRAPRDWFDAEILV